MTDEPHYKLFRELPGSYRESLEALFFFHPEQSRHQPRILKRIEASGKPTLAVEDGTLQFLLDGRPAKTLFLLDGNRLCGIGVWDRPEDDCFRLLHISVASEVGLEGFLRQIAGALRDDNRTRWIQLPYREQRLPLLQLL